MIRQWYGEPKGLILQAQSEDSWCQDFAKYKKVDGTEWAFCKHCRNEMVQVESEPHLSTIAWKHAQVWDQEQQRWIVYWTT